MSYSDKSRSGYQSRPVYLYEFRYTDDEADTIRLTSADHTIIVDGYEYKMIAIDGANWSESGGDSGSSMDLEMPLANNPVADLYLIESPDSEVAFTMRVKELDDPDDEVLTFWIGRVVNVSREYPKFIVTVEDIESSLDESGSRGYVEPSCRHVHFSVGGGRCELIKAAWETIDSITEIESSKLLILPIAATFDDGWFVGGELAFGNERRTIIAHSGDQLTIHRQIQGLGVGDEVVIVPGCDHTAETCLFKFNNVLNYGGEDFVPDASPWQGISIV